MVKESLINDAKLEFCLELSEYYGTMNEVYNMMNSLNDLFQVIKKANIFNYVDFRRLDTVMHNKLISTLKEFREANIDPMLYVDDDSNSYYVGNFYSRYILRYFKYLANNIIECINNLLNSLQILENDIDKYIKHHKIKFALSAIRDENIVLSVPKLHEDYDKCLDVYNEYRRLNDEFYSFDIKRDYLHIAKFTLDGILSVDGSVKEEMVPVQYNIDLDYLMTMKQEDLIAQLDDLYISSLEQKGMDIELIKGKHDKFFTAPVVDNNLALELTRLTESDLNKVISESVIRNINNQVKGEDDYQSSDCEIVEYMIKFNHTIQEKFKKLKKEIH